VVERHGGHRPRALDEEAERREERPRAGVAGEPGGLGERRVLDELG
jgi:hypothetical protein